MKIVDYKKNPQKIIIAFLGLLLFFGILFGLAIPKIGLATYSNGIPPASVTGGNTAPAASNTSAAPSIGLNPATWMPYFTYWITYAIYFLLGLAVSVAAYFIGAILSVNIGIVGTTQSPTPVSTGFPITLSIANLGFVLAIIIIAIATILRSQTYGIKQILWKLVVAAVLINFSLTIAGAIIGLADSFTLYFMKGISASPPDFASQLASSFQPQQATTIGLNGLGINTQKLQGALAPSGFTADVANSLRFIAALVFAILTFIIVIITLGALMLMLLVRYVFLIVLLILMPFAWLGWIFPFLKDWWQKWWHNFLKWTFFAPIVTFFLWLAITIAREHAFGFQPSILQSQGNDPLAAVGNTLTTLFTPLITNLLQVVALAGLMLGGLFAANSLSITFAGSAMNAVYGTAGYIGRETGRATGRAAAAPLRRPWGRNLAARMQGIGTGSAAGKIFGAPIRGLGRGMETLAVTTGENVIASHTKEFESLTRDQARNRLRSANIPQRIALLEKAKKEDWLNLSDIPELKQYLNEAEFKRYGRSKFFEETKNGSGLKLIELFEAYNKAAAGPDKDKAFQEIVKHFKGAPNPGSLFETFFPNIEKLEEKATREKKTLQEVTPARLDKRSLEKLQSVIVKGAAQGFSAKNWSTAVDKLTKGDNLDAFTAAIKRDPQTTWNDLSQPAQRWFQCNGARQLGVGPHMFPGAPGVTPSEVTPPEAPPSTRRAGMAPPP